MYSTSIQLNYILYRRISRQADRQMRLLVYKAIRLGKCDRAVSERSTPRSTKLTTVSLQRENPNGERGGSAVMLQWQAKGNSECDWEILSRNGNIFQRGVFTAYQKHVKQGDPQIWGAHDTITVNWTPSNIRTNSSVFVGKQNRGKT